MTLDGRQENIAQGLAWTRRYREHLSEIVAEHLVVDAPPEEDLHRATDLYVLRGNAARIGCRIRRHRYLARYGDEFTLRSRVPSGEPTELDKILAGWGDYLIYGFAAADDLPRLAAWALIDLTVLRDLYPEGMPAMTVENRDGTAGQAFRYSEWPDELLVARNRNVTQMGLFT